MFALVEVSAMADKAEAALVAALVALAAAAVAETSASPACVVASAVYPAMVLTSISVVASPPPPIPR